MSLTIERQQSKINARLVLYICLGFVLVSAVNQLLPISPNRIITLFFFAAEIYYVLKTKKISKFLLFELLYLSYIFLYTTLSAPQKSENLNDLIYFFNFLLIANKCFDEKFCYFFFEEIRKKEKLINFILLFTLSILGISLFFPFSYEENGAFRGFMFNSHAVASTSVLMLCLLLLCYSKNRKKLLSKELIESIVILGFLLLSMARTFLVPAVLIFYLLLKEMPLKKGAKLIIIFLSGAFFVILFIRSPMMNKFLEAANNPYAKNRLAAITNFRSVLWEYDLSWYWNTATLGEKILGTSFSYVRELHEIGLGVRLWSHNDATYILIALGGAGLLNYFYILIKIILSINNVFKLKKRVLLGGFVFFPLLLNGFYIYTSLIWSTLLLFGYFQYKNKV